MEPVSRRNALRWVVGGVGTSSVMGASVLSGEGLLVPASAAGSKKVRAELNHDSYRSGQKLVLQVWHHDLGPGSEIRVSDTKGLGWERVHGHRHPQRWTATAHGSGKGTVSVKVLGPDGRVIHDPRYRDRIHYRVRGGMRGPLIGMHAEPDVWAQRLKEVGAGVAARRIYGDLSEGASSQLKLVEEAHRAGMLPVISYKVGGDIRGAIEGRYNSVAREAARRLASYGLPTAVTFWHEPYGDLSGADHAAASRQLLPIFQRGKVKVGPVINGFLLDRRRDVFASYCPDDLFRLWDWVGIDSYEPGSPADPGHIKPADRIPALRKFVKSRGHAHLPLAVAEYNGYTAQAIADVGHALFTTPNVWFGCVWNSTGGIGHVLTGDRLAAFRKTLADPRNRGPRRVRPCAGGRRRRGRGPLTSATHHPGAIWERCWRTARRPGWDRPR